MPRGKSARQFALDLKRFGAVARGDAEIIFKKIALELDQRVVLMTPVDTGRARANWFPSINTSALGTIDASDRSGSSALSKATRVVAQAALGDVIWLTNNLPYILALENGHSGQAPGGMVDASLEAVAAHYGGRIVR